MNTKYTIVQFFENKLTYIFLVFIFISNVNIINSQPLKLGQSVVTSYDAVENSYNALKVIDIRNRPSYSTGGNFWDPNTYTGPNWDHARMGNIFGIAIDDNDPPNIFVTRSTVYCGDDRTNFPGMIYKIDGTTWAVSDYTVVANNPGPHVLNVNQIPNTGPGLGNICYDKWNKQLFVTNFEDGKIYRIKTNISNQGIVKSVFDPFAADIPSNGFVDREERIWGIGVYGISSVNTRVYFGRWLSDGGNQSNGLNQIWSIALDYSGEFIISSVRHEITLPPYSNNYSFPPSDIEFSGNGDMAVSERSMYSDPPCGISAHQSRILIYSRNSENKYSTFVKKNVGYYSTQSNSTGGVDFEYGNIDTLSNSYTLCDSVIVGTGDYLYNRPTYGLVYGVQYSENIFMGTPLYANTSQFIDLNGIYGTADKTTPGDIDVYRKNSCSCNSTDSIYIKDTPNDLGYEPNNQSGSVMWDSKDIWVQNTFNSGVIHQNPQFGTANFINVRIRNDNGSPSCGGVLSLQWAKASASLSWPKPWDQSNSPSPPLGGLIGSQKIPDIPPYSSVVLSFSWNFPNPENYFIGYGADKGHFCLLARIETNEDAPYGMTFPETTDLYANVKNNKKIAWKNVEVRNGLFSGDQSVMLYTGNYQPIAVPKKLEFSDTSGSALFSHATVTAKLSSNLYQRWAAGGKQGSNVLELGDSSIKILNTGAFITNILMDSNTLYPIGIKIIKNSLPDSVFLPGYALDVIQYDVGQNKIDGGNRYLINTIPTFKTLNLIFNFEAYSGSDTITVELRNSTSPYGVIESVKGYSGYKSPASLVFSNIENGGNYFIVVKHRNSIQTWSANPVSFASDVVNFDFTTSATQAYGNNMVNVNFVYSIYAGDVNQDGVVDLSDGSDVDNDAFNFVNGYVNTDVNGDQVADLTDAAYVDNNAFNFVGAVYP